MFGNLYTNRYPVSITATSQVGSMWSSSTAHSSEEMRQECIKKQLTEFENFNNAKNGIYMRVLRVVVLTTDFEGNFELKQYVWNSDLKRLDLWSNAQ